MGASLETLGEMSVKGLGQYVRCGSKIRNSR